MSAKRLRWLAVALPLVGLLAAMQFGRGAADGAAERGTAGDSTSKRQLEQSRAQARLDRGAYVVRSKQISATEIVQTVVIPEGLSDEFDTRCVIYQNSELRTSSITCSGILFRQSPPPS